MGRDDRCGTVRESGRARGCRAIKGVDCSRGRCDMGGIASGGSRARNSKGSRCRLQPSATARTWIALPEQTSGREPAPVAQADRSSNNNSSNNSGCTDCSRGTGSSGSRDVDYSSDTCSNDSTCEVYSARFSLEDI
jgi:hypothetical protein